MAVHNQSNAQRLREVVHRPEPEWMAAWGLVAHQNVRRLGSERGMIFWQDDVSLPERKQVAASLVTGCSSQPLPPSLVPGLLVTLPGIPGLAGVCAAQARDMEAAHVCDRFMKAAFRLGEVGPLFLGAVVMVAMDPEHRTAIAADGFQDIQERAVQLTVAEEDDGTGGLPCILFEQVAP